ncbi:MAG: TetR/AcrR family transcriptional regulator [Clostridia bacterium]|nr:TetR/AcrR family transcriptional regulator [Clostridia bacterium]
MADKKIDRRVKYTKQALKDSLISALQKKPIEKITVKELCEKADVNRGTFYAHYSDQFDLYNSLVKEFLSEAISMTEGIMDPNEKVHDKIKIASRIFKYVKDNCDLAKVLLNGTSVFGYDKYNDLFNEMVHKVYLDEVKRQVSNDRFVDMVYQFVAVANITLLKYWVNTGMQESEEEMAILAMKLTAKGVSGLN